MKHTGAVLRGRLMKDQSDARLALWLENLFRP